MVTTKEKLFIGVIVLLCAGLVYLFYSNYKLQQIVAPSLQTKQVPAGPEVVVGSKSINSSALLSADGSVTATGDGTLSFVTQEGVTQTVRITSATRLLREGERKTDQQLQEEMDAYNARRQELMKDPEANKEELETLALPFSAEVAPATLAQLRAGIDVSVTVDPAEAANPKTAIQVFIYRE